MSNPFASRTSSVQGPSRDLIPVTPDDTLKLEDVAVSLYVETGGQISFMSVNGTNRTVRVSDFSILPVGVQRVNATGTTASGIHACVVTA